MSRQKIQDVQDPIAGGINSRLKKRKKPTPMLNRQVVAIILLFFAQIFSQAAAAEDIVLYPLPEKHYQPSLYVTGLASLSREILQAEVNGELVAETLSNETGDFALRIPLQAGDNQLRIIGTTAQSAIHTIGYLPTAAGSGIWKVTGTSEAPDFPSLDPLPATTSDNPTTVTGTAPPETSVSFFVNGRYTRSIDIDASGVFSTWVPLEDNANSIYAIAENENGQSPASNTINTEYGNSTQREWSGTLSETLVWTPGDGTPYQLIGNLTIAEGATLWLQPGTRVDIAADYKLLVQGELVVAGDEASPVVLKPTAAACDGTNTWRQDWRGIEVLAAASATIEYAEIHCASKGVHFNGGDGAIRHTRLLNNHAAVEMIATSPETAIAPELLANEIRGGFYGISVQRNSAPLISGGNEITGNYYGLYVTGYFNQAQNPVPVVTGNSIDANTGYNYYASSFGNAALTVLDATDNWWGTTNPAQIAAKIYDWSDSPTSAPVVNYSGYLDGVAGEPVYSGEFLNGPIAADTTLSAGEYQIQGNVTIAQGTTLTIDPATQLNIAVNAKLQVQGALLIAGSGESPVVFKPTAAACDGTNTQRQDWRGIEVLAAASATIEYAEIHCASKGVHFNGGDGAIRHTRLLNNHAAVEMIATSPETAIAPELLANEIRGGFYGISVQRNSAPLISGDNEITGNYYGLYVRGNNNEAQNPTPVVTGNSIYANTSHNYNAGSFGNPALTVLDASGNWWGSADPAKIIVTIYDHKNNSSSPFVNYANYLAAPGGQPVYDGQTLLGSISEDLTLPSGDHRMLQNTVVESGVTLTLQPGASLKSAPDLKLQIAGNLVARGIAGEQRVAFSSAAPTPQPGDWYGIEVVTGGTVDLDYARIEHAVYGLDFNGGQGTVRNSLFRFNTHAIYIRANSDPLIADGNEITLNDYGVYIIGNGISAENPMPVITGNNLYGNRSYDLYTTGFGDPQSVTLDITGNWWGSADPAAIEARIYTAATSSPQVDFSNYLEAVIGLPAVTISGVSLQSQVLHLLAGESAQGLFTLNRAATVTVEIRRESDNTVVYQATENHPAAGEYPFLWNGRDNQGGLMPEDLYRVVLLANDGVDDFVYDAPNPSGAGSVSGAVPSRYNAYANDFYKISVNVASPSLVSMQVTPDGGPAFYVFREAFYPEGQHWLYWDGRDPNGDIIDVPVSVFYPAPLRVRPTAIYVAAAAPDITGPGAAPNIEVKSDPYLVSHSYEQLTRMAYRISNDAYVTFSLLPPGIVDPQDPSAIVLVDNVLQQTEDGSGESIQHEVEWRGYDLADPNAVLVGEEGAYTFAIQARSTETGETTLYRGVVNLYR
ncbi:FlgD immunoglobulin-like domain containing protein [Microbulbifer sp. TYP-18]|uniref:right-handed parallel beta-helix repeat-containing protein n=1 Tax=Microbulbifer sp. TYP-18 TaxID=3230024 RepID=UPI0034C61958